MSIFEKLNKNFESPFKVVPPEDIEYCKLSDLQLNTKYTMLACFMNNKAKYGEHGVATCLNENTVFNLSLPKHLNDVVRCILENEKYIQLINEEECIFYVEEKTSKKYNRTYRTIKFI